VIGLLWSPKFITTAYDVNTCIYFTYTQNHTIERIWLEVNRRVNYPLKAVLVEMADHGQLVLDDPVHQYCMSWISIQVANVGVSLFISSWNQHPIPSMFCYVSLLVRCHSIITCTIVYFMQVDGACPGEFPMF